MSNKKIIDYLTGKLIQETPEEYNRQEMLKILHEDYGYPKDLIVTEFGVKRSPSDTRRSVPVDIAVFESHKELKNKNPKIFIETKKPNHKEGLDQLKDYLIFQRTTTFGIWYNGTNEDGQSISYIKYYFKENKPVFDEITDVPKYGFSDVSEQITYTDLKPTNNLKTIFKNLRGFIAGNATGTTRDEIILEQLSMIILSKLYDEKYNTNTNEYVSFKIIKKNGYDDKNATKNQIHKLFNEAKTRWDDVFSIEDQITLDPTVLLFVVGQLQKYSLVLSNRNVISEAFESIISYATKGSQGQFFTPQNVAELMVQIANPSENESVFDPACGTASFLVSSMFYVWSQIDTQKIQDSAKYDKKQQYVTRNIFGIEKDSFLAKIAKAYMAVLGDGRAGIFIADSLNSKKWDIRVRSSIENRKFKIILTNPPFGKEIKLTKETSSQYEYGNRIELAFLEKSLASLEDGGLLGIILPETIFHAPSYKDVRKFFFTNNNITHLIDLPHDTFRPYNNAKCNIIFIRKAMKQQNDVVLIKIDEIGHNHQGKDKYVFDQNTMQFSNDIADDIPDIIHAIKENKESQKIHSVSYSTLYKDDLYVARPFFSHIDQRSSVSLGDLIADGTLTYFHGHGSPQSHLKGLGDKAYIRVKDIVNLEIAHNRLDDIPEFEYNRIWKPSKELHPKDIVFVRRGSYRIGDVGILYEKDINSLLTSEILVIRVLPNNHQITPFNFLYLLNSDSVRKQLPNKILMDTTLPNIGDRWKDLKIDISDKKHLYEMHMSMLNMYNQRAAFWADYAKIFGVNG